MSKRTTIRRASPQDIEALIGLLKALFSIEEDFAFDERKQEKGLLLMLDDETIRCVLVAEIDKMIIGMCTAQLLVSTAEGGLVALIEDVFIDENYRGQGIGEELLTSIEKWARHQGATRLQLLADRNNISALKFYQKMNWSKTQLICLRKTKFGSDDHIA